LQRLAGAVTYGAYRTASGIARTLPNFAADGFAVPAGLGANLTRPERRATIERQLRRVDPTLEGWRLRRAVQDAFDSYARYWIETFRLPTLPAKVVADGFTEEGYAAHIEGALAAGRGVGPKTKRTLLVAIQVAGVPAIAVEEALWLAAGVLRS